MMKGKYLTVLLVSVCDETRGVTVTPDRMLSKFSEPEKYSNITSCPVCLFDTAAGDDV